MDKVTPIASNAFPSRVEGRLLQLDGDAACYKVTFDDEVSFAECRNNFLNMVMYRMQMAGAVGVNVHLTGVDKGGRYKYATVKEYQGNRKGKKKPKNLEPLRQFIQAGLPSPMYVMMHENQEADDGMAQGNFKCVTAGYPELSVIMAEDKDLTMCSGLHCDWNSYKITNVKGFGEIYLDTSTTTTKIKGFGTSFFWAQLLTGDPADTIPGLQKLGGEMTEHFKPGKKPNPKRKPSLIGPALAWLLLKDIKNDQDALMRVLHAYKSFYPEDHTYTSHDGVEMYRNAAAMLYEQAQLLWMRRVEGEQPNEWFKDVIQGIDWRKQPNE